MVSCPSEGLNATDDLWDRETGIETAKKNEPSFGGSSGWGLAWLSGVEVGGVLSERGTERER
ncbi:hypothetical protein GCM10022631_26460 [Deinococcus rubellus]